MQNQHSTAIENSNLLQFRPVSPDAAPGPERPHGTCRVSPIRLEARAALSPADRQTHDVRNALCSLHMLAGLLSEPGVLAPSARRYADDLQSVTETLTQLVEAFTSQADCTPGQAGNSVSESTHAGTGEALQSCKALLQTAAGPSTTVYISSENHLPPLALGAEALKRILVNLVKNAGEALGASGGTVRITARRALSQNHPAVLIHISDNGPGIPSYALGQIFEPGFSSKQGRSCAPGLGLTVVRELIESVGGSVRVASTRRRGTTFELRIPAVQP